MATPIPIKPAPGQESVWDHPGPPQLERVDKPIAIDLAGVRIVAAPYGFRVLETSHPPVYYISPEFILPGVLQAAPGSSLCEWKGRADYLDVVANGRIAERSAWRHLSPTPAFAAIRGHVAFYAGPMDRCTVDGETVTPQPGNFYGGWITRDIVGPLKARWAQSAGDLPTAEATSVTVNLPAAASPGTGLVWLHSCRVQKMDP